jgi:oxygen-independent coproporphyrinogen-3 oxidase
MGTAAYVHIPFCLRKCLYCDFNSYPGMEDLFLPYVEALRREIKAACSSDTEIPSIFFGGGTPTLLPPELLSSVLEALKASFNVLSDAETSTEANPGTVTRGFLERLRSAGFNRLSLGVQSLFENELARLGRIHTPEEAIQAFNDARAAGFANINLDLMYGIPEETRNSWRRTLQRVLELGPEHISLYSLSIEEGTPFFRMYNSGDLELPGSEAEADMYEEAIRILTGAGFVHYEISNFARPGFQCRHNVTYWKNEPYFGFGAGAASFLGGVRRTNASAVQKTLACGFAKNEFGAGADDTFCAGRIGEKCIG